MTATFIVLVFLTLCISIAQIVLGIQHRKAKRLYHQLWKAERTKAYFAEARNTMLQFASEGKIDPHTSFFKRMYQLNTRVMRSPDSYQEISNALLTATLNSKGNNAPVVYSQEEKKISKLTADALGHIMIEYSLLMRIFFRVLKATDKRITKSDLFVFWMKLNPGDKKSAELSKNLNKVKYDLLRESGYPEQPHLHHELAY